MGVIGISRRRSEPQLPWFRDRARWAITVATALFVAVAFGRSAGLTAGLLAVVLVITWAAVREVDLTLLGWVSRVVPLLLLGGLLGDASDQLAVAGVRQLALEAAEQRQREATEINETLIQGMAARKWALEAGRYNAGLSTLEETLEVGHNLVSKLLREADMGPNGHRPPQRG